MSKKKEKFIEKTRKFLHKELSYDGSGDTTCPHCGKVTIRGDYWIDHYSSLASGLATHLSLTGVLAREAQSFFEEKEYGHFITGKRGTDSKELAEELYSFLYD